MQARPASCRPAAWQSRQALSWWRAQEQGAAGLAHRPWPPGHGRGLQRCAPAGLLQLQTVLGASPCSHGLLNVWHAAHRPLQDAACATQAWSLRSWRRSCWRPSSSCRSRAASTLAPWPVQPLGRAAPWLSSCLPGAGCTTRPGAAIVPAAPALCLDPSRVPDSAPALQRRSRSQA